MKLRELFESKKSVAIIFGRFNPPHAGHKAAWEIASHADFWYVGTNKSTEGPKDPLPFNVKVEAMKTVMPEIGDHLVATSTWLTLASMVYEKHGDVELIVCTDEEWVSKTINQYNGKDLQHGFYNFSQIITKPTPRVTSATAVRSAVMLGDRDAFSRAAGVDADTEVAGKSYFDLVAEYLLPYENQPKKVKKVKEPAESIDETCKYGRYYCSTDKKWKCRTGPKQTRKST